MNDPSALFLRAKAAQRLAERNGSPCTATVLAGIAQMIAEEADLDAEALEARLASEDVSGP